MKRHEEFQTPIGQAAWIYYSKWLKAQKRQVPRAETFLQSKFYKPLIRFARFVKRVNMPDIDTFIWLMREKDMPPVLWTNDDAYAAYLEFLDRRADPYARAQTTVTTLFQIADAAECDVSEVFDVLTGAEVVQLLRERRLSPWVLLFSKKFMAFVQTSSPEEITMIETIVRPAHWKERFAKAPEVVTKMQEFVKELNL